MILVGEMRDLETVGAAITAAETGHLVFSTLHTVNAPQTIERIIDVYPADEQNQIRSMLANTLQAVISQTLFKRCDQPGMIPGVEIMLCTPAVRNCIRENRIFEIPNIIETSRALGMQTLDDSIKQLVRERLHQPRRRDRAGGASGEAGAVAGCLSRVLAVSAGQSRGSLRLTVTS